MAGSKKDKVQKGLAQRASGPLSKQLPTMTVGALNGGRASNIIPDTAEIMVSFRTLSPEAYDHLLVRIPEILDHYVSAWHGTYTTRVLKTPSTVCDAAFSEEIVPFAAEILGAENVRPVPPMRAPKTSDM